MAYVQPYVYQPGQFIPTIANFLTNKRKMDIEESQFAVTAQQKEEDQALQQQQEQRVSATTVEDIRLARARADQQLEQFKAGLITAGLTNASIKLKNDAAAIALIDAQRRSDKSAAWVSGGGLGAKETSLAAQAKQQTNVPTANTVVGDIGVNTPSIQKTMGIVTPTADTKNINMRAINNVPAVNVAAVNSELLTPEA